MTVKILQMPKPPHIDDTEPNSLKPKTWRLLDGYAWNPLANFPRNEKCPCRSGKKFKRCCYLTVHSACTKEEAEKINNAMKVLGVK